MRRRPVGSDETKAASSELWALLKAGKTATCAMCPSPTTAPPILGLDFVFLGLLAAPKTHRYPESFQLDCSVSIQHSGYCSVLSERTTFRIKEKVLARESAPDKKIHEGGNIEMPKGSLQQLYIIELKDLYSAETQLVKALPKIAKASSNHQLRQAFEEHL